MLVVLHGLKNHKGKNVEGCVFSLDHVNNVVLKLEFLKLVDREF